MTATEQIVRVGNIAALSQTILESKNIILVVVVVVVARSIA